MKISSRIRGSLRGASLPDRRGLWSNNVLVKGHGQKTVRAPQVQTLLRQRQQLQGCRIKNVSRKRQAESGFFTPWNPSSKVVRISPFTSRTCDVATGFSTTRSTKRWNHSTAEHATEDTEDEFKEEAPEEHWSYSGNRLPPRGTQDKEEMMALVDQSQRANTEEYLRLARDPYMRGYASPDGPHLAISDLKDDHDFPSFSEVRAGDGNVQRTLYELERAIAKRLRNPVMTDIRHIHDLYQQLPDPRMPYLHSKLRHSLMMVLGREDKNHESMLRYFGAVADIQRSGLQLTRPEWNSSLAFAARSVGYSTETESAATFRLWKDMETEAGIKGNAVTFNILFDVASKAGNFDLAEMLYKEMEKRKLPFNRYHHVSLIHFFGLKMDSDGIRAAYKELVEAGEMVDSTVLNCVIAGFLRCGEEYAAERVYERMRAAHERSQNMPYRNYMSEKIISKVLMMYAKVGQKSAERVNGQEGDGGALRRHFQKQTPIVPDIQTYRILLNHYAVRLAALDKVASYLDDMKWFKIPLHGAIFLALFKGFANYGSPGSQWSPERLQAVWKAFQSALKENANGLYVDVWMAKWILRAFHRTFSHNEVWQVWSELRPHCERDFDPQKVEHFEAFLADLLQSPQGRKVVIDQGMFGSTVRRW